MQSSRLAIHWFRASSGGRCSQIRPVWASEAPQGLGEVFDADERADIGK